MIEKRTIANNRGRLQAKRAALPEGIPLSGICCHL
jgi:hypothetical protein